MNNIIVSLISALKAIGIFNSVTVSGRVYPEIKRKNNRITTDTVKEFLYKNNLISMEDYHNKNCGYAVITLGVFKAFQLGLLSLNCTKQDGVKNYTPVRVSTGLSGKMLSLFAISTISLVNQFCLSRMKNDKLVCSKCYVSESLRIDGILQYTQNMFILTKGLLPISLIPVLDIEFAKRKIERELRKNQKSGKISITDSEIADIISKNPLCRFESMGDLACTVQARNYLSIARMNNGFDFALWTKNPAVLAYAIDTDSKPVNLATVWSMSRVNLMDTTNKYDKYFDHKFIVVDNDKTRDDYLAMESTYSCKCGKHSCIRCRHCYQKSLESAIDLAVERLRDKKQK